MWLYHPREHGPRQDEKPAPEGAAGVSHAAVGAPSIRLQESGGDLLGVSGSNVHGNKTEKSPLVC